MRVVLVGHAAARARLRRELGGAAEIAGEFVTAAAARASSIAFDAMLLAADGDDREPASIDVTEALTPREIQVVGLLVEGLSNKTIGQRLGISDQTVKFHVASICGKLGAANRTEAVRLAIRRGLVAL